MNEALWFIAKFLVVLGAWKGISYLFWLVDVDRKTINKKKLKSKIIREGITIGVIILIILLFY